MKKFISILLTLALLASALAVGAVSASAQGTSSAPSWQKSGDNKIYFYADPDVFKDAQSVSAYIYTEGEEPVYPWGSNKWNMTELDDCLWIFDCSEHNVVLDPSKEHYVIITVDGKYTSNDVALSGDRTNNIITPTGRFFGGVSDGKTEFEADWKTELNEKPVYFRFYADPEMFHSVKRVTVFLYVIAYGTGWDLLDGESEDSELEYLGDNMWGFDLEAHGIELDPGKDYEVTIYINDKDFCMPLDFSEENFCQTIFPDHFSGTSNNRRIYIAEWHAVAPAEYYPPNHYVIPGWEKHDDGKIYFYVGGGAVHDFTSITCKVCNIYTEAENSFYMECEGNGFWSLDLSECGYDLGEDPDEYLTFEFEWGYGNIEVTTPINLTPETLGDLAIIYLIYHDWDKNEYSYTAVWYSDFVMRGDADGNDKISIEDATFLQMHLAEYKREYNLPLINESWPTKFANADCNCDGVININDVTAIQRMLAEFAS